MGSENDQILTEFLAHMNREPGASEQEIAKLGIGFRVFLPEDYKSILRFANGAAGRIGPEELLIYSIDEVLDANLRFDKFREGLVIFGSDGGGEAYVFDPSDAWSIGMMPWIPAGRKELVPLARSVHGFFLVLQNNERLGRK